MQRIRFLMVLMVLTVILTTTASCWGAPLLTLAGRGNGLYEVLAQGVEDVRDITLILTYDPETLSEPRIKQRGLAFGAMMTPDFSVPGLIRVGITSNSPQGIKGSGSVAMLSFNTATRNAGKVLSFSATLTSVKGEGIPLTKPQILADDKGRFQGNPFPPNSDEPAGAITGTLGGTGTPLPVAPLRQASASTSGPLGGGAPTAETAAPTESRPPVPEMQREAAELLLESPLPVVPSLGRVEGVKPLESCEGALSGARSILSLFREYTGPGTTIQGLTALFSSAAYPGFRQEPPIALADGSTKISVYLTPQVPASQSPNFALMGAKQVSLKRSGNEYLLELIPGAGALEASITLVSQGRVTEYPLVVAPLLTPGMTKEKVGDEAAFTRYLAEYAQGRGDLNSDGRTDYRDLYVYTANYLSQGKGVGAVSSPVAVVSPAGAIVTPQPAVKAPVPSAVAVTPVIAAVVPPVTPIQVADAAMQAKHLKKSKYAKKHRHARKHARKAKVEEKAASPVTR